MRITRKQFLRGAAAGIAGAAAPNLAWTKPEAPADSFPNLTPGLLPTENQAWEWEEYLAGMTPLFTGTPNHVKFVNFLDAELRKAKLTPQRKTFTFPRWELLDSGLKLGDEIVPITSHRPYSGSTPASGITAPMHYAGTAPNLDFSGASGKIVLIEVPPAHLDWPAIGETLGTYPMSEYDKVPKQDYEASLIRDASPTALQDASKAGAIGAIYIWLKMTDANAQDQLQPFSGAPIELPTVWVGNATGDRLKKLAAEGKSINFTFHATSHPDTATDNLWAVLPGTSDEVIIINTHTDGCNACEENGAIGVISLAKYFAALPVSQRNRTLVFLMTTGHFGHGYVRGTQDWRDTNPDLMKKAVACVTIEHLGATEWIDDPAANTYKPSGKHHWARVYTPMPPAGMVYLQAVSGTGATRAAVIHPYKSYAGEGAGFWAAGIPTISYITGPQYLMTAPAKGGQISKLDKKRMYGEIQTFTRCVAELDKMSAAAIRGSSALPEKTQG